MRFTPTELGFALWGGLLGFVTGFAAQQGLLGGLSSTFFPPFVFVLLGLGLTEIVIGLATGRAPGTFVGMPARLLAFIGGVVTLYLVLGRLA